MRRVNLLAAWIACMASVAHAIASEPGAGVLDLPGSGTLPGTLATAPEADPGGRATLVWRSPAFTEPFEFRLDEIVGIRFAGPWPPAAVAQFRFRLAGGNLLDGTLDAVDATHVTLTPTGGAGPVRVRRETVEAISRAGGGMAAGYVGPGGLVGWEQLPANAWRSEAGRLVATRSGSVSRDVAAPARAIFDLTLSWQQLPEVRISLAAAEQPAADPYRVEWLRLPDGAMSAAVIREEATKAVVEPCPLGDAGEAAKSVRLLVFVDQAAGRLGVCELKEGTIGAVTEVTVPPPADRGVSGRFRLALSSGDVCLESLRVTEWTAAEPAVGQRTATTVITRDGRSIEAALDSFVGGGDAAVVLSGADGPVRVAIDDIDEIVLGRQPEQPEPGEAPAAGAMPTIRIVRASGGTLAGRLVAVDAAAVRMRIEGSDDVIAVPLADLAVLIALAAAGQPGALPGRVGTLTIGEASLRGCVVDGGPWNAGIAWQPQGSLKASPLAGDEPAATVDYVPRARPAVVGDAEVEVGGIGGMVNEDPRGFFVVTMLSEDGAAAVDGRLLPGDRLLEIKPREDGAFVPTNGLDSNTVMNLLRGRVGSPVVLRVAAQGGEAREIALTRGLIYVAGRDVLEQAIATHARLAAVVAKPADADRYPAVVILRSGDVVPCAVEAIDGASLRLRTPVADGAHGDSVNVPATLVQAVELDPAVAARDIERARFDRLVMLPRSQRSSPPTHMVRLRDGDYLRGRVESLDDAALTIDVRGEAKRLPRAEVARVIWLHPQEHEGGGEGEKPAEPAARPAGLLVQGVGAERLVTLIAEGVAGSEIRGTSPALGAGVIDTKAIERLMIGRAIDDAGEDAERPYRQWRLKPAPEPRSLREDR